MAIAFVQSTGKQTGDAVTSKTITLNGVVAGNTIFVLVSGYSGPDAQDNITVTDGDGKYTRDAFSRKASDNIAGIWRLNNASSGTHSIVIDLISAGSYISCAAVEFSSTGDLVLDMNSNFHTTTTSTTPSSGATKTTTVADELVLGVCSMTNTQATLTVEVTSPTWTEVYEELSNAHIPGEGDYKIVSATAAYTANWTGTSACGWTAVIATYYEASSGSGGGEHSAVF